MTARQTVNGIQYHPAQRYQESIASPQYGARRIPAWARVRSETPAHQSESAILPIILLFIRSIVPTWVIDI